MAWSGSSADPLMVATRKRLLGLDFTTRVGRNGDSPKKSTICFLSNTLPDITVFNWRRIVCLPLIMIRGRRDFITFLRSSGSTYWSFCLVQHI